MFPLLTPHLVIRPLVQRDADELARAVQESLETVGRWLSWCTPDYDVDEACDWVAFCDEQRRKREAFDVGVFARADDALLGSVGINDIRPAYQIGNIGYWVRQSAQGRGIALEAVQAILPLGFQRLGLTRLEIVAAVANRASRRVAEKAGAHYEGIARNRLVIRRQLCDAAMYSLIPALPAPPRGR